MKKIILIPGEKKKIQEAIQEAREEMGTLSSKQKNNIIKQVHKKEKRKFIVRSILVAAGIGTLVVGTKYIEDQKVKKEETRKETEGEIFKKEYAVDKENLEKYTEEAKEKSDIEKEVEELESKEDVVNFLKDKYVEQYEELTGDDTLTTKDIKITSNYENYVYVNSKTGEIITHGENPEETEKFLKNNNISYEIKYNVKMYKVRTQDGEIIDCATLQNKNGKSSLSKVIVGDKYESKYDSTLAEMGTIIPKGIEYVENIEKDQTSKEIVKRKFIESLEESEEKNIEDDEMELN